MFGSKKELLHLRFSLLIIEVSDLQSQYFCLNTISNSITLDLNKKTIITKEANSRNGLGSR